MKRVNSAKCWSLGHTLLSLTFRRDQLVSSKKLIDFNTGREISFKEERHHEGRVLSVDAMLVSEHSGSRYATVTRRGKPSESPGNWCKAKIL